MEIGAYGLDLLLLLPVFGGPTHFPAGASPSEQWFDGTSSPAIKTDRM